MSEYVRNALLEWCQGKNTLTPFLFYGDRTMRSRLHRLLKIILGLEKLYLNKDKSQPPQTLVIQIIVIGENSMGDKIAITGTQDSIFNMKADLTRVHQSINRFSEANSLSYELHNLNSQLKKELRQLSNENEEEAEAVLEYAKRLLEEAAKPKPNKTLIKISGEGLLTAAKNIAAIAPTVLTIATQIIETIARYITIYSPP